MTKRPVTDKNRKGQHYYRLRIKTGRGQKPIFRSTLKEDIWFYNRTEPNSPERKHNEKNKRLLNQVVKGLKKTFDDEKYAEILSKGDTPFLQHAQWVIDNLNKTESTKASYKQARDTIKDFMKHTGRAIDMSIINVDFDFVSEFRSYLIQDATNKRDGSNINPSTASKRFVNFGTILRKAKLRGLISSNPYDDVNRIQVPKHKITYLTEQEFLAMQRGWDGDKNHSLYRGFMFACFTGLRGGDTIRLRWRDLIVNGEDPTWIELYLVTQKKDTEIRFRIPQQALQYLPDRQGDDDFVFPRLRYNAKQNELLKRWAVSCGVKKKVTSHVARHSFAIYILKKGHSLYHLSKLLGHRTTRTTEEHYATFETTDLNKIMMDTFGG